MEETLFVLGREPALSVAELEGWAAGQSTTLSEITEDFVVIEHNQPIAITELNRLGGSIKLVEIVDRWPIVGDPVQTIKTMLTAGWLGERFGEQPRIEFGLSAYGLSREQTHKVKLHALALKKQLKGAGKSVRFVDSKEPQLSAVTVQRQGLLKNGQEFVLGVTKENIYIGVTRAVQDYQAYGVRDFGRPAADAKSGMLPPKVAQMMLNIARLQPTDVLMDPFVGSGTIVQEALLLGVKEIHASDTDPQAVKNTQENVRWLFKEFPKLQGDVEVTLRDVRQTDAKPTLIVTEPYLGKPLRGHEPESFLQGQIRELEKLYHDAFVHWKKTLKPGGRIVMIWPEMILKDGSLQLTLDDAIAGMGFTPENLISGGGQKSLNVQNQKVLTYGRPDARVKRQIRKWILN